MPLEDFLTYTTVDNNGNLTVTSTKVDVVADEGNSLSYVRFDKGVGHFGDFEHLIEGYCNTDTTDGFFGVWWAINNLSDTWYKMAVTFDEGEVLRVEDDRVDVARFWLNDYDAGNQDFGDLQTRNTLYYCTIQRSGTTLSCMVYSDAARTVLVDTLTLVCTTLTYRWIYSYISYGFFPENTTTHYVQNFDLQEVVGLPMGLTLTPAPKGGIGRPAMLTGGASFGG